MLCQWLPCLTMGEDGGEGKARDGGGRSLPPSGNLGGSYGHLFTMAAATTLTKLDHTLSVAPMMDWTEESYIIIGYIAPCALPVHQEI